MVYLHYKVKDKTCVSINVKYRIKKVKHVRDNQNDIFSLTYSEKKLFSPDHCNFSGLSLIFSGLSEKDSFP